MALPRFHRLEDAERERILSIAADTLSERPLADSSLIEIAEAAGLSRSAMYNYFDGRDDLIDTVRDDARRQAMSALESWNAQPTVEAFWDDFHRASDRLRALLAARPALRSLLAEIEVPLDGWLVALVDNAVVLGIVPAEGRDIALSVTGAVLAALDRVELADPGSIDPERVETLLTATWAATG